MNANGRRYRQAKNKFNHLAKRQRPNYKMRDKEAAARHNAEMLRREKARAARKGSKK